MYPVHLTSVSPHLCCDNAQTFSLTGGYVGKADRDRYFKVALDTLSSPADKSGSQVR